MAETYEIWQQMGHYPPALFSTRGKSLEEVEARVEKLNKRFTGHHFTYRVKPHQPAPFRSIP